MVEEGRFKSAYRRVHLKAATAVQSAVRLKMKGKWYILISLRLPFGGSPCPPDFCIASDIITDTINDLLACENWNQRKVASKYVAKIPREKRLDRSIPFAKARELSVNIPADDSGKADCFVDDIISCAVDIGDNLEKLIAAPCTVIHAFAHKATSPSIIPRQNIISDDKNEAEGAAEEVKICLGWEMDTRRLLIRLPEHKFKAWSSQILATAIKKTVNEDELLSILGRLENVTTVMPMLGHFLNNIRALQINATRKKHNVRLSSRAREDLKLSQHFLARANKGVSMNSVVFRKPDIVHIGDASEHGLGAFASHGRAWRFVIPENLRGRAHINLLEFLTQVVSIWIDIIERKTSSQDCILCMGDSTTAMGWLRRSNFREKDESNREWEVKQNVARKMANLVLDSETVLYRQWFEGEKNVVADSLSRDAYFYHLFIIQPSFNPLFHYSFQAIFTSIQFQQKFALSFH